MIRPVAIALLLSACNVPLPKESRGTRLDAPDGATGDAATGEACARALIVAESDYTSTNVALVGLGGEVLAPSVASSATRAVGLAAPLSGDVVLPTMPVNGKELVLVDRFKSSSRVLWVDPETAAKREMSVATGFWSDPHDYVAVSSRKAYVTRFNTNASPGEQPFDGGGDVLVVDPAQGNITGSIEMAPTLGDDRSRASPDADRLVLAGERAFVVLDTLSRDFSGSVFSRLVAVDTNDDRIVDTTVLEGLAQCFGLALSPDRTKLAVLCGGKQLENPSPTDLESSGVAILDIRSTPKLIAQYPATNLGQGPVGFFGAFTSNSSLLVQVFGYDDPASGDSADDEVVRVDLKSGSTEVVLRSAGQPFTLGGVVCDVPCGVCFVADAQRQGGIIHRFTLNAKGALSDDRAIKVETDPGLPPRYLGFSY